MLRTSVSKIKQYEAFRHQNFGVGHQAVVDMIKGVKTKTFQKSAGQVADAFIMDALTGSNTYAAISAETQIVLHDKSVEHLTEWCRDFKTRHPILSAQVDDSKIYDTYWGPVRVTMRLDLLVPDAVHDIKTSAYGLDVDNYLTDVQGWFYCDIMDVSSMWYDHFKVLANANVRYDGCCQQLRVPEADVMTALNRFLSWVHDNDLQQYLMPRVYDDDTILSFGKHAGKAMRDVPDNWLDWIGGQSYAEEGLLAYIKTRKQKPTWNPKKWTT